VGLIQGPLLDSVYHLNEAQRDNTNAIVQLAQLLLRVVIATWIGWACDKIGRRPIILTGVILNAMTIYTLGDLPLSYAIPCYIANQLFQEIASDLLTIPPLLADFIDYDFKGRIAGLSQVIAYTTLTIMTSVLKDVDLKHSIPLELNILGIIALVTGLLVCLLLKGGKYHKNLLVDKKANAAKKSLIEEVPEAIDQINVSEQVAAEIEEDLNHTPNAADLENRTTPGRWTTNPEDNLPARYPSGNQQDIEKLVENRRKLKKSIQSIKSIASRNDDGEPGMMAGIREAKNPWIAISYICGFLSQANMGLLYYVLVTYVVRVTGDEGAANQAIALTNKHYLVGIFTAMFFGFFADKYNKFKLILFVYLCSVVAVILILISPSPYSYTAYVSMLLFGVSGSGNLTTVAQLQAKYATPKYRASVSAVGQICGAIGSAATSILGAWLMQYNVRIPFYIYLACATVGLIFFIGVYISKRKIIDRL